MPVKINGASSGSVTLAAPSSGSDVTLTLPTTALATTAGVDAAVAPMGLVAVAPTSIANSGGSASLSNYTVSFSGCSSVSLNGVFTGDYDNYRVIASMTCTSLVSQYMRLRASGTDNSTANSYFTNAFGRVNNGVDGSELTSDQWDVGVISDTYIPATSIDIYRPYEAVATAFLEHHINWQGSYIRHNMIAGFHNQTVAYDGLTLRVASGSMTGIVSVYGYKK